MELCLRNKIGKNKQQNKIIIENIIKYFQKRESITLPIPLEKEEDLQLLNNIHFSKLKSNFGSKFLNLKKKYMKHQNQKFLMEEKLLVLF